MLNSYPHKILAIDPGKTIGYALAEITENVLNIIEVSQQVTDDWNPCDTHPVDLLITSGVNLLRIESFVGNGPRTSESCHTLKMIGGFKMVADQLRIPYKECAPGTRTRYIKKGADIYKKVTGKSLPVHACDAFAHLLRELADMGLELDKLEIKYER